MFSDRKEKSEIYVPPHPPAPRAFFHHSEVFLLLHDAPLHVKLRARRLRCLFTRTLPSCVAPLSPQFSSFPSSSSSSYSSSSSLLLASRPMRTDSPVLCTTERPSEYFVPLFLCLSLCSSLLLSPLRRKERRQRKKRAEREEIGNGYNEEKDGRQTENGKSKAPAEVSIQRRHQESSHHCAGGFPPVPAFFLFVLDRNRSFSLALHHLSPTLWISWIAVLSSSSSRVSRAFCC